MLGKGEDCKKILEETPLYMWSRMILVFPWEPNFDLGTTHIMDAPVWVDLMTLNPVFERSTLELLGQVGPVIYPTSKHSHSKFSNVCGCVRVDLSKPFKEYVVAYVEDVGHFKIDVEFWTLLEACFFAINEGTSSENVKISKMWSRRRPHAKKGMTIRFER